jgi:hypothetical protein
MLSALITLVVQRESSRVLAAAPAPQSQTEILPLKPQPPTGQKPGTELVPIKTGTLTGLPAVEWYINGLQLAVTNLQEQVRTLEAQTTALQNLTRSLQDQSTSDQATLHTLQASLKTLQDQFVNHSHTVSYYVLGHECGGENTYWVGDGTTHNPVLVTLNIPGPCGNDPKRGSFTPSAWVDLKVSTPVQGATAGSYANQ